MKSTEMRAEPAPGANASLHRSRSAGRVLALIDAVITNGADTLGAAAASTELPTSTALRHLLVAVDEGWLGRLDDGRFVIGPRLRVVAGAVGDDRRHDELITAGQPLLDELAAATQETACLGVPEGANVRYLASANSPRAVRYSTAPGQVIPAAGTAIGHALGSVRELGTDTSSAPPSTTFRIGVVEPDVAAISAPVFVGSAAVAAISLVGPASRFDEHHVDRWRPAVAASAARLTTAVDPHSSSSGPPHKGTPTKP